MKFVKKHTSKDVWMVKMLAGAAIAGASFFYLGGFTPSDVLIGLV